MMSPEEMERTINFIVEQQAQTSVKLDRLVAHEAMQDRAIVNLIGVTEKLAEKVDTLSGTVEALRAQSAKTDEQLAETDKRLNAFILVVERHIAGSNGNGKPA